MSTHYAAEVRRRAIEERARKARLRGRVEGVDARGADGSLPKVIDQGGALLWGYGFTPPAAAATTTIAATETAMMFSPLTIAGTLVIRGTLKLR